MTQKDTRCDCCGHADTAPFRYPDAPDAAPVLLCATCRRNQLESVVASQYLHGLLWDAVSEYLATYKTSQYLMAGLVDEEVAQLARGITQEIMSEMGIAPVVPVANAAD